MLQKGLLQMFAPPDGFDDISQAHFIVASVPVEGTVSYGGGTAKGPTALLEASQQVELFDVDERNEPYRAGIATLPLPDPITDAKKGVEEARRVVAEITAAGKIPVILGGEHSLTVGALESIGAHCREFSILHFDAHGDLRDTYHGDKQSHASALRRCIEVPQVKHLVQVGIRNVSNDPADGSEYDFICANSDRITVNYAKDMKQWDIDKILAPLSENIFITFDVDTLDSALIPSTGTPEPGGLDWYTTLAILKRAAERRTVIGMDFVEFAPLPGFRAPDFMVAKLVYKAIGYVAQKNNWLAVK